MTTRTAMSRSTAWTSSMILLLLAVLLPSTSAAQSAQERIQNALDQADEAGIPTSLLQSKIDEGRAKGIPMERIADAVQRRLDGLDRARQALADVPDVTPGDLDVSADALQSGVSEAVLTELAESAPADRRAAAIAALGYLVDANMAPQRALDQVQDALARGPQALQNLPAQARGPGAGAPGGGPPDGAPGGGPPTEVGPPDGVPTPGDGPGAGPSGGPGPGGGGPGNRPDAPGPGA